MQIIELAAKLQSLGLTDKQARVYVSSLFLGSASVQKIAEQAEINRATAYVIFDELADLGLVSQSTEGKKTVYIAEPPEAFQRLFETQKQVVDLRLGELKGLMPQLKEIDRAEESSEAPVVRFVKGKDGVLSMNAELRRRAKPKTVIYGFTDSESVRNIYPEFIGTSTKHRVKKKIASRLFSFAPAGPIETDPRSLREVKKLNTKPVADISLFTDTAAFTTYDANSPVGVVIESKEIVGALRQLYELAWQNQNK